MANLKGKTVIVTGGGRAVLENGKCGSIGYGIATAYAKEGANLVITGRNVAKLEKAKEELVPAMGCTEPIAIAYAAAILREALGEEPRVIHAGFSGNIIKNVKFKQYINLLPAKDYLNSSDGDLFKYQYNLVNLRWKVLSFQDSLKLFSHER